MMTRLRLLPLLTLPLLLGCTRADASPLPSRIIIASPREPGQRLIVSGRIVGPDGRPRGGVYLRVHHADAHGVYLAEGAKAPNPAVAARLWGELRTASDGTYSIETIKPAAYGGVPAHMHIVIRDGVHKDQLETLEFAGDPALTPDMIARDAHDGTFSMIRPAQRDASGVLRVTRDFRLAGGAR